MKELSVKWLRTVANDDGVPQFESSVNALYGASNDDWLDSEYIIVRRIAEHADSNRDVYQFEAVIKNVNDWELEDLVVNGVNFGQVQRIEYINTAESFLNEKDFSVIMAIQPPDGWVQERLTELGALAPTDEEEDTSEPEPETPVTAAPTRIELIVDSLNTYDGRFTKSGEPYLNDLRNHADMDDITHEELEEAFALWEG